MRGEKGADCNDWTKCADHDTGCKKARCGDGETHAMQLADEFPPDCQVSKACAVSRERAAQAFPHKKVFDNVQYDAHGWLTDPRLIAYFLSHPPDPAVARITF